MQTNNLKNMIITTIGAVGSFMINLLGGWNEDLTTLLILMGIDYIMGLLIAAVWKKSGKSEAGALSSWSAWKGLCRKGISLLVVLVAHRLEITMGMNYIRTGVIIAFIADECISIIENLGIMGAPLPSVLIKSVDALKSKIEEEDEQC